MSTKNLKKFNKIVKYSLFFRQNHQIAIEMADLRNILQNSREKGEQNLIIEYMSNVFQKLLALQKTEKYTTHRLKFLLLKRP